MIHVNSLGSSGLPDFRKKQPSEICKILKYPSCETLKIELKICVVAELNLTLLFIEYFNHLNIV